MSLILNLDTATAVCSVALAADDKVIAQRINSEGRNHAALLTAFIEEVLNEAAVKTDDLDAIAVSKGPGSYTGLRIGVSTAKGMAYGLSIPLISAGTLKVMASGYLTLHPETAKKDNILLCPMIDARRMEVYTSFYDTKLNCVRDVNADIVDKESYVDRLGKNQIIFFGDGAAKCRDVLTHPNAIIDESYVISANQMVSLTFEKFRNEIFEDVAYFEPFYLKDFVATIPKNKII
jgi:tRNA threonylcarbamoyladenosine biosynthesis protein TsaB